MSMVDVTWRPIAPRRLEGLFLSYGKNLAFFGMVCNPFRTDLKNVFWLPAFSGGIGASL